MAEDLRSAFGGGRVSSQRRAVADAAKRIDGAFTVEDLAREACASSPGIGTATVYRAVGAMEASGYLERVGSRDGSALYLRCGCERDAHHHHLVCTGCGAVAETACPLAEGTLQSVEEAGYVVTSHEVVIYGLCPRCARDDASAG